MYARQRTKCENVDMVPTHIVHSQMHYIHRENQYYSEHGVYLSMIAWSTIGQSSNLSQLLVQSHLMK